MQTVVIAGGAGFIGSHLCETLLSHNYRVICVDNVITGNANNIASFIENPNFSFINHNIIQPLESITDKIDNIRYIFHLASPASPNKYSKRSYIQFPIETLLVNSVGTYHLLQLAKKHNARFVFASTSEVYGNPAVSPQPETYFGNVNPNGIRSVYDEGKRFGEAITMAHVRKFGLDSRIIRIFNTYGPKMQADDGRVVSNFINQALHNQPITIFGKGEQTRSFCYISDMIEGLCKIMFTEDISGEVINVGNPEERAILAFAKLIKKIVPTKSGIVFEEMPEDDPKQRKPDITKAKRLLGWEPKVSIEEGLDKTAEYFKKIKN